MGCGASGHATEPNKAIIEDHSNGENLMNRRTETQVDHIELTESVVEHYIQLEKDIHRLEMSNVTKKYEDKVKYADELKKNVDHLEATYKELKKQTDKEKADIDNIEQPSVRAFLKYQGTYEKKFNQERQGYLDSLNKQEVAQKELQGARMQFEMADRIAELYKKKSDKLNEYYDMQDKLLAGIFAGKYGSDTEYKLEIQLDEGLEWQQRVSLAKFKWTNARVLLVHACAQIAFGIKRWKELEYIELNNTRMRYFTAAEARNNFIAAGQNIQSCRVYLGRVQFPYCTEEQMDEMEKCVNNAFSDIQTKERYRKSLSVYHTVHRQVAALIQWFDQVLAETILPDLEAANNEVARIQQALRKERLQLIKGKVKKHLGREFEIDYSDIQLEDDVDEKELMALDAEKVRDADDLPGEKLSSLSPGQQNTRPVTPVPLGKLAPLPSEDTLFGNINDLKKQHERERKELERRRELARARMDQGLQEKLHHRRSKKERLQAQHDNQTSSANDNDLHI